MAVKARSLQVGRWTNLTESRRSRGEEPQRNQKPAVFRPRGVMSPSFSIASICKPTKEKRKDGYGERYSNKLRGLLNIQIATLTRHLPPERRHVPVRIDGVQKVQLAQRVRERLPGGRVQKLEV